VLLLAAILTLNWERIPVFAAYYLEGCEYNQYLASTVKPRKRVQVTSNTRHGHLSRDRHIRKRRVRKVTRQQ